MKRILFSTVIIGALSATVLAFKPVKVSAVAGEEKLEIVADAPSKWVVDKSHSNVKFTVTHMVVSDVDGSFKVFDGAMEHSKADYSDAKINFSVDVASVDTDSEMRDKHLKGDDFFNAEMYPAIKFESTSFTPVGGNKYKLAGNLTIRDVTKPVVFETTYGGIITNSGKTKSGFKARTTINRFDYNLKWNRATEAGGLVVGKEVELIVNVELNKA